MARIVFGVVSGLFMAERNDREHAERVKYSLRGDFGPPGSWCKFGDRPDFTHDYEWRYRADEGPSEDWGRHPGWSDDVHEHYSGGTQTYGGSRVARK
jgi:hypothetical protein